MIYFSYGSNMSFKRLNARIANISRLGVATLYEHDLRFHKVGNKDGSGKCDILETYDPEHTVIGVVYKIDPLEKHILDTHEGLGNGYEEKQISVEMNGDRISAFTYYATHINQALKPLHWYKEHVLRGARENKLPEYYIQKIQMIDSITDQDFERHTRELAIYSLR
ncbi:MAG: gamma-glutamylcyclotransferase [Gammaproteobacteria bacterium]